MRCSKPLQVKKLRIVGAAGIEPATLGLEIRCSIRLSYAPVGNSLNSSILRFIGFPVEGKL